MKVNLAAQALSSSVADAIEFCTNNLKLKQFEGSEATVKFIRTIDHLFDILNSRNPCAKGFKAPLKLSNQHLWKPFLTSSFDYLKNLKNLEGKHMHLSRRKTGFIGFMVGIKGILALFDELVA